MSLTKSILLGSLIVASNTVLTPPTVPPQDDEREKFAAETIPGFLIYAGPLVKYALLGLFSAEQLCLMAGSPNGPILRHLPQTIAPVIGNVFLRLRLTPTFTVGTFLVCAAAVIRRRAYSTLGRFFTFELALRKEHKLVTSGPYRVVRHPAYTGAILFILGARMCIHDDGSVLNALGLWDSFAGKIWHYGGNILAGLAIFSFVRRVKQEDEVLRTEFRQEWREWARTTPCRLIPGIW